MKLKTVVTFMILLISLGLSSQTTNFEDKLIPKDKIGVHNRNFKLNGFYYNKRIRVDDGKDTVRAIFPVVLYENGLSMGFDQIGNSSKKLRKKVGRQKCILQPRQDFKTILDFFSCRLNIEDRKGISAVYSIDGDIIRIQYLSRHVFSERRGIVLNDSMFLINKRIDYTRKTVSNLEDVYYFKPAQKPDSLNFEKTKTIQKYFFQ